MNAWFEAHRVLVGYVAYVLFVAGLLTELGYKTKQLQREAEIMMKEMDK